MMSLEHPELIAYIVSAGPGLWPLRIDNSLALAIKGSSELIFSAKKIRRITFHYFGLSKGNLRCPAIVTAIYDREDEPLVIRTTCFDKVMRQSMLDLALATDIEISFFDSHGSELFGGRWLMSGDRDAIVSLFAEYNSDIERKEQLKMQVHFEQLFSDPAQNGIAIDCVLQEEDDLSGIVIVHMTDENVSSRRREGLGIYVSDLDPTDAPGALHEADLARILARIFGSDNVYVNPETAPGQEFCDVLVVHEDIAIAVQAKTIALLQNNFDEGLDRREARIAKGYNRAASQASGADRAFYELGHAPMLNGNTLEIDPSKTSLFHLIVLHEKARDTSNWFERIRRLYETGSVVVVLSHSEFLGLVDYNRSSDAVLRALVTLSQAVKEHGISRYSFGHDQIAVF